MEYFDIAMVVPLEEELIQVMEQFPSRENRSTDTVLCHVVDSGNPDVSMIVVQQQGMGRTHAVNAANMLLARYEVGLLVCLGIAGSLSEDMRLADVCYTGNVVDVLDNAKAVDREDAPDTELSPTHYTTPLPFTSALGFMRTQPELQPTYRQWQAERAILAEKAVPVPVPAPDGSTEAIGRPATKNGAIVCGMVSKSKLYNEKLRAIDRALLAVETESGGIFAQAKFHGDVPGLTIRGISDYADKDKKKLEQVSKGAVRELAASNAASFLRLQITSNPWFAKAIGARRTGPQAPLPLTDVQNTTNGLADVLEQIAAQIDDALRKLSPEYKLQPKGYRLPLPRVRRATKGDGADVALEESPAGIREAIERADRILIGLARTYPDQSLAWVMAEDLLTAEVGGKQVVPIVIDGEAVRSKRSTFAAVSEIDLAGVDRMPGAQLVFIVENIPFSSKHRLETILKELDKFPAAKFVFIARGDGDLISESDFTTRSAAISYDACSISFIEIAHFIQKNFGMTGTEAEVVALRLRDTFNRFELDAHPTYFAGIPKETLSALLHANRRSELIQLAVDGFLTFLVAGDKADVALSRSTRARFLRRLVVEIHVEKRSFDEAALITFTREFADLHDFDIESLAFISGFVDQGILHFESNRVHVSLPFIESYLLASELAANPDLAFRYFDLNDMLFDMATFDLYSEIGAAPELVERIVTALDNSTAQLAAKNEGEHVLLGESISPVSIRRPERAENLRKRLKTAAEAVRDGTDKSNEKQQMLDLSDKIREATGKQQKMRGGSDDAEPLEEKFRPLNEAARHWTVATVLLGSGAEHLQADTKRKLSSAIVHGAAMVIDEWSRAQSEIDFDALKRDLTTDEALTGLPGPNNLEDKRRFVVGVLDLLEYAAMADPLRRVIGFLCEQARHRVLAPSVANAETTGLVEAVIHGTWLVDIDATRGRLPLREAMRQLPRATFFRIALASHYLARVYWAHSKKEDRLILLGAAEDAIEPLEVSLNKPELKRYIDKTEKAKKDERNRPAA